jgi:hypothetical protein
MFLGWNLHKYWDKHEIGYLEIKHISQHMPKGKWVATRPIYPPLKRDVVATFKPWSTLFPYFQS